MKLASIFARYFFITESPLGYPFGQDCLDFPNSTVCFMHYKPWYVPEHTTVYQNLWEIRNRYTDMYWYEMMQTDLTAASPKNLCQKDSVWHLKRISQRQWPPVKNFDYPYSKNDGSGVDVYVLDTWIDVDHPQFDGRAKRLRNFLPHNPQAFPNHGTHCAGLVAGVKYGPAKSAQVYGVQVLGDDGVGDYEAIIKGLHYTLERITKTTSNPRSIISLSLGGPKFPLLDKLVEQIMKVKGIPVVAAAGNDNNDASRDSPGGADVIVVGATNYRDQKAEFSNYGRTVKIYAPGDSMLSACPQKQECYMSGTSMATPLVAGVMAVEWSRKPKETGENIWKRVKGLTSNNRIEGLPAGSQNRLIYLENGDCD